MAKTREEAEAKAHALVAQLNAIPLVTSYGIDEDLEITFTGDAEGGADGNRFHFHVTFDTSTGRWRFDGIGDWEEEMTAVGPEGGS